MNRDWERISVNEVMPVYIPENLATGVLADTVCCI